MSSSRKNLKNVSLSFELFPKKSSLVLCNSLSGESCFLEQLLFMMFLDQSGQYLCATNISCNTWHLVYTQNSSQLVLVTQFIENDFIAVNLNLFFHFFLFIFFLFFGILNSIYHKRNSKSTLYWPMNLNTPFVN